MWRSPWICLLYTSDPASKLPKLFEGVFPTGSFLSNVPVSYTHLDVYTRQRLYVLLSGNQRVYQVLIKLYKSYEENGTYSAYISRKDFSEMTGLSERTITRAIKSLVSEGYITKKGWNITMDSSQMCIRDRQGVDYVNSTYGLNVEATRINTGSFTDVNQAKETAISIIEGGADVISPMANDASVGIMEAGEEKGVMAVGCGLGQESSAPTATKIIIVKDVAIAIKSTFDAYAKGELNPTEVETYGANKGCLLYTSII